MKTYGHLSCAAALAAVASAEISASCSMFTATQTLCTCAGKGDNLELTCPIKIPIGYKSASYVRRFVYAPLAAFASTSLSVRYTLLSTVRS